MCGKSFNGVRDQFYCPDCVKALKSNVIRTRTCKMCGKQFEGGPRAMYCSECKPFRRRELAHIRRQNGGTKRPIGSIDTCHWCGAEYSITSGLQKYCSTQCQQEALLQWQKEHKKGYHEESGQYEKKLERRKNSLKICKYCGRHFHNNTTSSLCSDYCREKQAQISQCKGDLKREQHRNIQKLFDEREEYRKSVSEQTATK